MSFKRYLKLQFNTEPISEDVERELLDKDRKDREDIR